MKPAAASILALAISLASSFALASPEGDAKENVKIEKKDEAKPKDSAKDSVKDSKGTTVHKPSKHHARTVSKGRAHEGKGPAMMAASARQPATTGKQKESKPAAKPAKKIEKKGDQKHPATHATAIENDPGAMDHQGIEHHMLDHHAALQPAAVVAHESAHEKDIEHAEPALPALPPPSSHLAVHVKKGALENVSAQEPVAPEKTEKNHKVHGNDAKSGAPHETKKAPCVKPSIEFMRGTEADSFPLLQCDGTVSPSSLDKLSIMLRPASVAKPGEDAKKVAHKTTEIAPGIMKVDSGLAARLEKVMDHFKTDSHTPKVSIVSGYRPTSVGSFHALGRAIDFHLDGVDNAKLVEFCKTLPDTGCGFYPNSSFVHMDVRDGKASWIDASGPGEAPRYVTSWPPPANPDAATEAKAEAKRDDAAENKLPGNDSPTPENTHPDTAAH
jgi:hypothetical protein